MSCNEVQGNGMENFKKDAHRWASKQTHKFRFNEIAISKTSLEIRIVCESGYYTYWRRGKVAEIMQTIVSDLFFCMATIVLHFHQIGLPSGQLKISHHQITAWHQTGNKDYLINNQWRRPCLLTDICVTRHRYVNCHAGLRVCFTPFPCDCCISGISRLNYT